MVSWGRSRIAGFHPGNEELAPSIIIPRNVGALNQHWLLAHELAHLVKHSGPKGLAQWRREEAQADRWAACALIPDARIHFHANASLDSLIASLSAHYEDLPYFDCPARCLAAKIAKIRLKILEVSA